MPPITRSKDCLSVIDGLFFIEQDTIDLAANIYSELKTTASACGEESIVQLVPHITSLFIKLNDVIKSNIDLKGDIKSLQTYLSAAEERCMNLDVSFKDKSVTCCELEEQYEADMNNLNSLLGKCKEENASLKERLDLVPVQTQRLIAESQEKIEVLTAERKGLLTTMEVLEAEIKCLQAELRRAETRAKQRRPSTSDDLLSELHAAEVAISSPLTSRPPASSQPTASPAVNQPPTIPYPSPKPHAITPPAAPKDFKSVLVIGDSHVRHAGKNCAARGAFVECLPGGKITDVKNRLLSYLGVSLDCIYFHVGCNNLRRGYRGGPGYNGGHGKREALHAMADLLYTAKTSFPGSRVFLSSVLVRRDIGYKALHSFNAQLELMCNNFSVEFVDANSCVSRRDLSRDGVHFSHQAVTRLGSMFEEAITMGLATSSSAQSASLEPEPESALRDEPPSGDDVPQDSGN